MARIVKLLYRGRNGATAATRLSQHGCAACRRLRAAALAPRCRHTARARVRIKDIAHFEGVRGKNHLSYGLGRGLLGRGQAEFQPLTRESIRGMLELIGVANLDGETLKTKNTAAVMVTAKLPPFLPRLRIGPIDNHGVVFGRCYQPGRGGTLLITPLTGCRREVYAFGQGAGLRGLGDAWTPMLRVFVDGVANHRADSKKRCHR